MWVPRARPRDPTHQHVTKALLQGVSTELPGLVTPGPPRVPDPCEGLAGWDAGLRLLRKPTSSPASREWV